MLAGIKRFKEQNFDELKSFHNEENLFEDPYFLADDTSLFPRSSAPAGNCFKFLSNKS